MFYNPKIVIKRIKELQGDESENSMAKRLGISQVTLNYCLSGKRKPSLDLVYRICDIYGSSIDWLLGLTDQRSPFIEAPRENKVSKTPEIREKFPSFGSPVCRSVRQYYKDTTNGAEKQERKDQEDDLSNDNRTDHLVDISFDAQQGSLSSSEDAPHKFSRRSGAV